MGVVVDGQIYVPGGRLASDAISDALEVYDPRSDSWQSGPALPAPRSGYALAAVEGRIYLFGGWDGTTYRDEVWQYDPDQDSWNVMSPMLTPRAFAGATALDGRIFILGGENASGRLDFNESYSPAEDRNGIDPWLTHGRISESRSRPAVAQSGELLLLFGGEGARAPLLVYNRRIERWQPQNDVPLPPLSGLRAVESSNVFYVLGGRTDEAASEKVFRYRALYTVFIPLPAN
jgi:N-acetylneuraminic acid mutarotase